MLSGPPFTGHGTFCAVPWESATSQRRAAQGRSERTAWMLAHTAARRTNFRRRQPSDEHERRDDLCKDDRDDKERTAGQELFGSGNRGGEE